MTPAMPECLKPYAHRKVRAVVEDATTADNAVRALVLHLAGDPKFIHYDNYVAKLDQLSAEIRTVQQFWGNAIDPCS